jgi:predicted amidohydrolase YtcJ
MWSWVREDATHWSLTAKPGHLRIVTQTGGIYGAGNNQQNLLLVDAPVGDYLITTRVTIAPSENFQHAALLVYQDDDNYVQLNRAFVSGGTVNFDREVGGVTANTQQVAEATTLHLCIAKMGSTYRGFHSPDGQTWTGIGHCTADLTATRIGLGAANGPDGVTEIAADFDFFETILLEDRTYLPAVARGYRAADTIFVNGTVLTMENDPAEVEALAIRGDTIVAVGSEAQVLSMRADGTRLVDLGGRTLLPGFVDTHTHLLNSEWTPGLVEAQQAALESGITTLGEAYSTEEFLIEMRDLEQTGGLRVRTSLFLGHVNNCGEVQGDWYKAHPPTRNRGEMLRIGGVKVFTDGGSCGAPAVSFDHPVYGYGDLWFSQEELNAIVAEIQAAGHQAAIHALGDRAVDQVLNGIEFALDGAPNTPRHRIEHNGVVRDDMLERYAEVDPVALIFGSYPACQPFGQPLPEPYTAWEWRWPDLLDAHPGGHFAWHSDRGAALFPVAPLMHLFSMVTPFEVDVDGETVCDTPDWIAHKLLTVEQALPMMTVEAAHALFREEEVGSLRAGKLADLIILSGNPLAVAPDAIQHLEVCMTMVGGKVEYCGVGYETLCPTL